MSDMAAPFPDRIPCRVCGHTAYDLSEIAPRHCAHDDALCGDCNLGPDGCPMCRLEAERDMYATGTYSPHADPFYRPERKAADDQPRNLAGFNATHNSYRRTR